MLQESWERMTRYEGSSEGDLKAMYTHNVFNEFVVIWQSGKLPARM